ncbi:FtsW/RodA/SpoVE family cell cycle protein [Arcanobacterium haemolyticum]|uniref:Cell cycle protein n=1 Tax=Arcanobacterium haemolyticum (strain ATCC 9345 / DSM 20595 / CCM 5947 / CCUG 17215 / LMG 16163 / NBRC 15585 / NCTC 8452 / 11018) TaxID=644284 RepID=D7BLR9_ARCHD|nr:FtsW/RodA/SpoVE family cell cycle protein [Arcanobacterium haemolyticum]ADH91868.1 cell cycle protein [Arcanobacterium haemolyticum DSM 20595]QCX46053.1 FtsW/RodA/SpoVE family cell cycle protein [Arcanobacterium haemolyticum]SQH27113.1 Cell division protein FtsW [Arcanobacterium haemolyticum]
MSVVSTRPARSGRNQELGLLILAFVIPLAAWILVHYGVASSHPDDVLPPYFGAIAGGGAVFLLACHMVIRRLAPYADPILFPAAVALTGIGLTMIYRIDFQLVNRGDPPETRGQLVLTVVAILLLIATVAFLRDHRWLRRITYSSLIAGLVLLLLPLVPVLGVEVYGAQLWINILGFSYQPAELAKILLTVFFAGYLVAQRDNLSLAGPKVLGIHFPRLRHSMPILVAWLSCMGILALERDFGTALLFFGLFVAMLYVATERTSWIVIGGVLSSLGVYAIVQIMPHIQARFTIWLHALDPEVYSAKYGSYQLVQGWFGMASGGLFGTGLGEGSPANSFAANSDFIIASLGEELGLVGLLSLLSLYVLIVTRAMKIGITLRDGFGKLLAAGLGFTIALQCFVVVGGITRVIPLTGLAMPFLAKGGSALLTNFIIIGILIRMSDSARRPFTPASTPLSTISTGELPQDLQSPPRDDPKTSSEDSLETTAVPRIGGHEIS